MLRSSCQTAQDTVYGERICTAETRNSPNRRTRSPQIISSRRRPFKVLQVKDKTVVIKRQLASEEESQDQVALNTSQPHPRRRRGTHVHRRGLPTSLSSSASLMAPSTSLYRVRRFNHTQDEDIWDPTANIAAHLHYIKKRSISA